MSVGDRSVAAVAEEHVGIRLPAVLSNASRRLSAFTQQYLSNAIIRARSVCKKRAYFPCCRFTCTIEKQLTNSGQLGFWGAPALNQPEEGEVIGTVFVTADSAGEWGPDRRYGHLRSVSAFSTCHDEPPARLQVCNSAMHCSLVINT